MARSGLKVLELDKVQPLQPKARQISEKSSVRRQTQLFHYGSP
ncbi:hypothetical protein [Aliterella atlantica]|nr:hypothetical protein [Aliterella atlantica]